MSGNDLAGAIFIGLGGGALLGATAYWVGTWLASRHNRRNRP